MKVGWIYSAWNSKVGLLIRSYFQDRRTYIDARLTSYLQRLRVKSLLAYSFALQMKTGGGMRVPTFQSMKCFWLLWLSWAFTVVVEYHCKCSCTGDFSGSVYHIAQLLLPTAMTVLIHLVALLLALWALASTASLFCCFPTNMVLIIPDERPWFFPELIDFDLLFSSSAHPKRLQSINSRALGPS